MRFQCPFCRGIVSVDNTDMGTDVQCGHCGERVTVPTSRVATGAVIGDFIILRELGRGGMGIVYLAHQISLDRPAGLKILAENYANNAEFVVGFIKEARSAAKLNHPNIVQAYAVGEDEGIFYFAMEYIDGETMKNVLKREHVIPIDQAISIIQQISEALDYAWKEQKLIHRDIKPDNIMLTSSGRAKLADLGLAKVAGEIDDSEDDEVMGTPQYISPEHLTGAPMDSRSDIYSLGATFYHFITGRFPYEGATASEIAQQHLFGTLIPPNEVNTDIPETLSRIVMKMMAKDPALRYQDAAELADDLRLVRRGQNPVSATETGALRVINSNMNLQGQEFAPAAEGEAEKKTPFKMPQLKLKSQNAAPAPQPAQQFTQTETIAENKSFTETANEVAAPKLPPKPVSLKMPEKPKPAEPPKPAAPPAENEAAEKLKKAQEMAKKAAAKNKGKKKNGKGKPGEGEKKNGAAVIILLAVVLLGAGGFFGYQYRKQITGLFYSAYDKTVGKISGNSDQSPYMADITQTLTLIGRDSSDTEGIIRKAEEFLAKHPVAETDEEKAKLAELLQIYIPLDESRFAAARDSAHQSYTDKVAEKERALAEAAEAERKRKAEEAERQRKAAEERRLAEQKRQQIQKEITSFKNKYAWLRLVTQRSIIEFGRKNDEAGMLRIFENNAKEIQLTKEKNAEIRKMANSFVWWSNQLRNYMRGAFEIKDALENGNPAIVGIPVEIRFNLCKVKSVSNGVLTGETTGGKEIAIPVKEMNTGSRPFMNFVKKVGEKLNKPASVPFYFLWIKEYNVAHVVANEENNTVRNLVSSIFNTYLSNALRQKNIDKEELENEFGRLPEYKKLAPKKRK